MLTAVSDPIISRRAALRGMIAAVLAGIVAVPRIAVHSADARLIGLCCQLDALQDEFAKLFSRRTTIEQEEATEPEMAALHVRQITLVNAIEAVGTPTTMAGIVAIARAALAIYPDRDADGIAIAEDDAHWLLLQCAEALAMKSSRFYPF